MLTLKAEGKKLSLSNDEKRKVRGSGICGQGCKESCPLNNKTAFNGYFTDNETIKKWSLPGPDPIMWPLPWMDL